MLAAINQRHLAAQTIEYRGQLHRDIAAAQHHAALGQGVQMEEIIGDDAQLLANNLRYSGAPAGGHQNVRGAVALAVDADRMGIFYRGIALHQIDLGAIEDVAVNAIEAGDFTILAGDQRLPVEAMLACGPAEACSIREILVEMRTVRHQFFRNAADIDTGATQLLALGNRHPGTVLRGKSAGPHAAGTSADGEQIVIVLAHVFLYRLFRARVTSNTGIKPTATMLNAGKAA